MHNRFGLERWQSLAISAPLQAIVRRWNARKVGKAWMLETRLVFILARHGGRGRKICLLGDFFGLKHLPVPPRACSGKNTPKRQSQSRKTPPQRPASQMLPSPPALRERQQTDATRSPHTPTSCAPRRFPPASSSREPNNTESPIQSQTQTASLLEECS
jgi:hypothetical protein